MSNAATKRTRILTNAEWLGAEIEEEIERCGARKANNGANIVCLGVRRICHFGLLSAWKKFSERLILAYSVDARLIVLTLDGSK